MVVSRQKEKSRVVFLKLFSISAPLNNLLTFECPLQQKVEIHVFDIYLNNVISNSVVFNGMDEDSVWLLICHYEVSTKEQSQVSTVDYFKTISLAVQKRYHRTKCTLFQVRAGKGN